MHASFGIAASVDQSEDRVPNTPDVQPHEPLGPTPVGALQGVDDRETR